MNKTFVSNKYLFRQKRLCRGATISINIVFMYLCIFWGPLYEAVTLSSCNF